MTNKLLLLSLSILMTLGLPSLTSAQVCITSNTAWYVFPNLNNVSLTSWMLYPNCALGSTFSGFAYIILILVLYAIMIVSMGDYPLLPRVTVASATFTIMASALTIIGVFDIYMPVLFGIMTVVATVALFFETSTHGT